MAGVNVDDEPDAPGFDDARPGRAMTEQVILAIDEGTTGTRAGLVKADGSVEGLTYRRPSVASPTPGVVEQDAAEILDTTLEVVGAAVAAAQQQGYEILALAISTQRATMIARAPPPASRSRPAACGRTPATPPISPRSSHRPGTTSSSR